MADFRLGDRVRVRATADTLLYAGRTGEVDWVNRDAAGAVLSYYVRLDASPAGPALVYTSLLPDELEPATE